MQFPSILTISLLFVALSSVAGEVQFKKGSPYVTLTNGDVISGAVKFSRNGRPYNSFISIPYAIAERFQEPQPVTSIGTEGIFQATKPGSACPQLNLFGNREIIGDEDCLNLNVYVPISNSGVGKKGYAVMVWIHGGGFIYGNGHQYGPQFFMDEDVILVTLNYRLGVFGFLSTGDNVVPGNNGLKDMVLALKWVKNNIKQFGGNENSITAFGESAGGSAVHHLLLSPTTKGLINRVISQSGSALNPWSSDANPRENAVELATYLQCSTSTAAGEAVAITSDEILTCFKEKSVDELIKAQFDFKTNWSSKIRPVFFGPAVENVGPTSSLTPFQSELSWSILTNKAINLTEISWMVGSVKDEGAGMHTGFMTAFPEKFKEINTDWNNIAPLLFGYDKYLTEEELVQVSQKIKQFYFEDKDITEETMASLVTSIGDELVLNGVYKSAMETAVRGKRNPVYLYQYTYKGPVSVMGMGSEQQDDDQTVGHADDLQHLFVLEEMFPGSGSDIIKPDTPHEEFSKNFVRLWASFAIHGEPKHSWGNATFNRWKSISKKDIDGIRPLRWFRIETNPISVEIDQSTKDRMLFWDGLWSEYFIPSIEAKQKQQIDKIETSETVHNEL